MLGLCSEAAFAKARVDEPVPGATKINICAHELDPSTLRAALKAYLGMQLDWTGIERKEAVDLKFSGSVDGLLNKVGLRNASAA